MTTTARRGGPDRTGSVEPNRRADGSTYYRARIRLEDGSRVRVDVPEKYSTPAGGKTARERAELYAEARQEREDETGELYAEKVRRVRAADDARDAQDGETCDRWFGRYNAYQRDLGHTDAKKKANRWGKWISPLIGPRPIASITRDDAENVRDALDRAIAAWKRAGRSSGTLGEELSGKTAMNVWSALTSSFKAATSSKRRDLRVLEGRPNPCLGVEPPGDKDSRKSRRKTFVYPREAAALLFCVDVAIEWREIYAIAFYTFLRPGELRVLTWDDVDLEVGHVSVTKAWDYADGKIKPPKSRNGVRKVPLEPALVPLLKRMKNVAGDDGGALVVPSLAAFGPDHLAKQFRRHLKRAGVARAELHATTTTHVQANFRSCRDSGITWLAMTGLGVDKIQRRAGHEHISTTLGYVKQTEDLTGELGAPFASLPDSLLERAPAGRAKHRAKSTGHLAMPPGIMMASGTLGGIRTRSNGEADAESRTSRVESPAHESTPSARIEAEVGPTKTGLARSSDAGRGVAIASMYEHAAALAAAGDVAGARALHAAIGRLLDGAVGPEGAAEIVDLKSERERRSKL